MYRLHYVDGSVKRFFKIGGLLHCGKGVESRDNTGTMKGRGRVQRRGKNWDLGKFNTKMNRNVIKSAI